MAADPESREMFGRACESQSEDDCDYGAKTEESAPVAAPRTAAFVVASRTRLNCYWIEGTHSPPPRAARELFSLLVNLKARFYAEHLLFTGVSSLLDEHARSVGIEELPSALTFLGEHNRAVVAAALECVLAEAPTTAVLACGVEFLTCFFPLVATVAQRTGREGRDVLLAALARDDLGARELAYVHEKMPEMHTALRVFHGYDDDI